MTQPPSHWAVLAIGLVHLATVLTGGPGAQPSLPPCALEAVCPPAWLQPADEGDAGDSCPPCPEAPPCPGEPAVCAAPPAPADEPDEIFGVLLSAAPGLLVALITEATRRASWCRQRVRQEADDGRGGVAPARRGGGVVR